jgi:hypothetical protein
VVTILILALTSVIPIYANVHGAGKICDELGRRSLSTRPHSVSITDFGAVGDGKTLNTLAFQNAVFYLMSFADKGGAQLYVPPGHWLTGSFSLTSHLTLFLENGAVIVASQVYYNASFSFSHLSQTFKFIQKPQIFTSKGSIALGSG